MEKFDEEIIFEFKVKYKGFTGQVEMRTMDKKYSFEMLNKRGKRAMVFGPEFYMNEECVFRQFKVSVNDCINNPEEYYDL